jgi:hypothetical protein
LRNVSCDGEKWWIYKVLVLGRVMFNLGSKYEDSRKELAEKIRVNDIIVIKEFSVEKYACYFCSGNIDGEMYVLYDVKFSGDKSTKVRNYLHEGCFMATKHGEFG